MTIGELLKNIPARSIFGDTNTEIGQIRYNSREVEAGDVFVAINGFHVDGHIFIPEAIRRGAAIIIHESESRYPEVIDVHVANSRQTLARMADRFYNSPASALSIIGITGTNGKTTTAFLIKNILDRAGFPCGLIGTIQYQIGNKIIEPVWTTPEAPELHHLFAQLRDQRMRCISMEVSSHALKQDRVFGLQFRVAVFTNLSRDHLDFHKDMEDYQRSKEKLFEQLDPVVGWGVSNLDDPVGKSLAKKYPQCFYTYSAKRFEGDIYPDGVEISSNGIAGIFETPAGGLEIKSPLNGEFNVYNILAAIGVGVAMDVAPGDIVRGIEQTAFVPGRFEKISVGQPFNVIIDFAHTPDSVERSLAAARKITKGKIIALLGCGGDRDAGKRPLMGQIVSTASDICIITSDNPRTEKPEKIIDDIYAGISHGAVTVRIADRKSAIEHALSLANEGDTVILLGKGHERYQIIGTKRIVFDDHEISKTWLEQQKWDQSPVNKERSIELT